MPVPAELLSLPQAITELSVRQRPEHERAVRAIRWGERPVWAIAAAQSIPAAELFRCSFEDFLGQPLIVREASEFAGGCLGMIRPGCVVTVLGGDSPAVAAAVHAARKRGAQVLMAGGEPGDSTLPPSIPAGAAPSAGPAAPCLEHAAAAQLGLCCARQLTRADARLDRSERDWRDLPSHLDRIFNHLDDGIAALARDLEPLSPVVTLGGGYYSASAARLAITMRQRARLAFRVDPDAIDAGWLETLNANSAALVLSASGGRSGKAAAEVAGRIRDRGCPVFAVTGSNHYELIRQARLTVVLPEVGDLAGSILALAIGAWAGILLGRTRRSLRQPVQPPGHI
jgi:DNA-binding MurR/RpiR family transcriptional regulator